MKTRMMKEHEEHISRRLQRELERIGVPLRMDMKDFNNPDTRKRLMRDAVIEDRKRTSPEDDSDVDEFLWCAFSDGNHARNEKWVDMTISSWTASPKKEVA
jgi:hypothetical protein